RAQALTSMAPDQDLRFLVCDDDADVRDAVREALLAAFPQASVHVARSGVEALSLLQTQPISLLITDFRMPEMDGLALIRHLRRKQSRLPVILMTAYANPELEEEARFELKVEKFLRKPFRFDSLIDEVRRVLPV